MSEVKLTSEEKHSCESSCQPVDAAFAEAETPLDDLLEKQAARSVAGRQPVVVCRAEELPVGGKRIVEQRGVSVGVFNIDGRLHAVKNVCPHYGAPLCRGNVHATHRPVDGYAFDPTLEGRVIRCPWHGWEFDIVTGKALYDRKSRVAIYKAEFTAAGDVVVWL